MEDRSLNLLIAAAGSEEEMLGPIRDAFEQNGIAVGRCDLRTGKNLIMQYLSYCPDTDVVILSQYQGTTLFPVSDIDNISTMSKDLKVIVIVNEKKGSAYMRELEACGIYTAVFEKDGNYEYIAQLVRDGRSKREARLYYGVTGGETTVQTNGFNAENAVIFLSSYNGSLEDLTSRLAKLSEHLQTNSAMLEVLAELPNDVFSMVSRIERYSSLCGLVEEQRYQLQKYKGDMRDIEVDITAKEAQKRRKKGKNVENAKDNEKNKLTNVDILNMEGRRDTLDVGFIATNIGVGCTTSAIQFAHGIAQSKKGIRIAIVEFDNADTNFETLCRLVTGERNTAGLTNFSMGGVDYYFNMPYSKFSAQYKPVYDVVVYDLGCCDNASIENYFLRLHTKFVVCSAKEWRYGELADFVAEVSPLDVNDSFIYLFPCVDDKLDMGSLQELVPSGNIAVAVPYIANPYAPGKPTVRLFTELFQGSWKGKHYKQALHVEDKVGRKTGMGVWKAASLGLGATLAGALVGIVMLYGVQTGRYNALRQQAAAYVADLEGQIADDKSVKEALEEALAELDMYVYLLKDDVAAGMVITKNMVEESMIKTNLDESLFLKDSDLGKKAACVAMYKGTPLLNSMVAEPTEEVEAIPEELLELLEEALNE